ncbi:hypothetical protein BOO86_01380 [Mycobacterium sp. CBMA 234]|uniref:hypothetical protein n=1 Tax=Mycolicibacterium sp. CBMA 234 TaxID=1918495 RepID=UPI0012DD05CE|nr:hypothetical protein [Mycolicibacterium sp. CBMA 234]MUL63101.1 hypothetical protein [Mycolicibacterium sp. CBMA 234]
MTPSVPRAEAVLQVWERGRHEHPIDRALTILSLFGGQPRHELAAMSVERRDAQLLGWRTALFGDRLPGYSCCPQCGCGVDVALSIDAEDAPDGPVTIDVAGRTVTARMPTTLDLVAVAGCASIEESSAGLVTRCIEDGTQEIDTELARAVEAEWERRARLSAGVVLLACPDCYHHWSLGIDIAEFLWRELEIHAIRLVGEVDLLARRYGWSEPEILALSTARRRLYLGLAS